MESRVSPDMTEVRVLVQFCTIRVHNLVFEEKKKKACFADQDLSSWTGKSRSGHDRSQSFGPILHILGSKLSFGPETCKIEPKLWLWTCPDLPRPVQEDKYLLQTSGNTFFFRFYTSPLFINKSYIFRTKNIWFYKNW